MDKKEKVAILPRPLASSFGLAMPFDDAEFTFNGYVFAFHQDQLPVCSFNSTLEDFKSQSAPSKRDLKSENRVFLGLVDSVDAKAGVSIRFHPKNFTK